MPVGRLVSRPVAGAIKTFVAYVAGTGSEIRDSALKRGPISGCSFDMVGKIGIRDSVLQKPDKLTDDEFNHIKEHPEIGARLTARFPDFAAGTRYIRHHHERFDGSGYPAGLKGKDIPLGARIIAVADTYDAMTSTRVYRAGLDDHVTQLEMERVRGAQLDPEVVDAWFAHMAWQFSEEQPLAA